jgi:hypothetical protein
MSKSLGHASLTNIRDNLNRIFKTHPWWNWELETISDELHIAFDELTRDKVTLLQILTTNPELFFENASFFLHATEVINNKIADFEWMPMPTSLELAYAITEVKKLLGDKYMAPKSDSNITDVVIYLLREEGYSEPVYPFEFIPKERLTPGQTEMDTAAKKKAIEIYIDGMNSND